jgi:hypothetical protein
LTGTDRFVPRFAALVKANQERTQAFCQLFVSEPGNPGLSSYSGSVKRLRDELCGQADHDTGRPTPESKGRVRLLGYPSKDEISEEVQDLLKTHQVGVRETDK